MNKVCKEYIKEIRILFPIKRKQEREYTKKLASDIEAYCDDANITSKQELYNNYGKPFDVVSNYISSALDSTHLLKRLKLNKTIRTTIAIILALAIIVATNFFVYHVKLQQELQQNEISIVEDTIEVVDIME